MQFRKICLVGGTGFVGKQLATRLARDGFALKVLTRRRERHRELLVFPRIEVVETDIHYVSNLTAEIGDCDALVNTVGILNPEGTDTFDKLHAELPAKLAEACAYHRIGRLVHLSALGAAEDAPSEYLRSKWAGEQALADPRANPAATTIFRPSVIFGPGDSLFTRFAQILALKPLVFPLASAGARMQPVFVGDVVEAISTTLGSRASHGQTYELGGPDVRTLREIIEYTADLVGVKTRIWELSDAMSELQARVLEKVPGKPLSVDNLRSLRSDSVTAHNALPDLGISPTAIDAVVPGYLGQARQSARLSSFRTRAGR